MWTECRFACISLNIIGVLAVCRNVDKKNWMADKGNVKRRVPFSRGISSVNGFYTDVCAIMSHKYRSLSTGAAKKSIREALVCRLWRASKLRLGSERPEGKWATAFLKSDAEQVDFQKSEKRCVEVSGMRGRRPQRQRRA